jgi:hypothetical protein
MRFVLLGGAVLTHVAFTVRDGGSRRMTCRAERHE